MRNIIGAVILGIVAIVCFVFGYLQFHEKGFLFNNAYIYASKQERETMDIFTQCFSALPIQSRWSVNKRRTAFRSLSIPIHQ
ncbi:hypothetical protein [Longicatena caecimuris]|uniref:hypothetical protein n=1 Tax=Longicatena caecimuris TaxID=1796635 RepID=UPI0022E37229|nr:hypothetical protein [Longicatena caecimuris]